MTCEIGPQLFEILHELIISVSALLILYGLYRLTDKALEKIM